MVPPPEFPYLPTPFHKEFSLSRHPVSLILLKIYQKMSILSIKQLFWVSDLTKDMEFDMCCVGNPEKKGETMKGKVIIYGKAG
jgi:hypothetical protein